MKFRRETGGTLVVSLEKGDPLRSSIESLAAAENVPSARVTAIGAVEDAELGFYDLGRKEYLRRSFPGILELVSLEGSITVKDGKPFLHAHVAIAGSDFIAHGGHLFDARSGVVIELFILPLERPLVRVMCDEIGLARWEP